MSETVETADTGRRDFLKLASVSAPVAVAVAVGSTGAAAAMPDQDGTGLRDTAHTRAYFESARF